MIRLDHMRPSSTADDCANAGPRDAVHACDDRRSGAIFGQLSDCANIFFIEDSRPLCLGYRPKANPVGVRQVTGGAGPLQIAKMIVGAIAIKVIDVRHWRRRRPKESESNQAMNPMQRDLVSSAKDHLPVTTPVDKFSILAEHSPLAASNAPHVSTIGNFVNALEANDSIPVFHKSPFLKQG